MLDGWSHQLEGAFFGLVAAYPIICAIIIASVLLVPLSLRYLRVRPLPGIPYPPGMHWLFGHLFVVEANLARMHDWHLGVMRLLKSKVYQICVPGMGPTVVLNTPENLEYFFKTNFDAFEKADIFRENLEEVLGQGIFVVDGTSWREKRKTASHMFSEKVLRDDMHRVFASHARSVLQVIRERSLATANFIDIQAIFFQFTMDSICEIAFGQDIDTLHSDSTFGKAFDSAQAITTLRFLRPPLIWKLERFLNIGGERQLKKDVQLLRKFCEKIITDRQKIKQDDLRKFPDLLSRFISDARERNSELSSSYLRDVVLNFMIAGRDTTACLLTWAYVNFVFSCGLLEQVARGLGGQNL